MEEHGTYLDGAADICSIILSTDADDPPLFDLSGPSFSEPGLEGSPRMSEKSRARSASAAKPPEFLRDAAWQSLAEVHDDHQQLRSTLHRAGQLCSGGSADSELLGAFASHGEYRGGSSLLEAVTEMPEWGTGALPKSLSEGAHMPETIRAELRLIVSEAINTMGGQVTSIRSAMQDHLLEHSSAHCSAVHGVRSDFAQMSTDVKEMRSVVSGMRSIILEAFTEMAIEIRKAVPATVADLKEEICNMRDTMLKSFKQQRDIMANLHAECRETANEDQEKQLAPGHVLEEEKATQEACEDMGSISRLKEFNMSTPVCTEHLGPPFQVTEPIPNQELMRIRSMILEASEQQRALQVNVASNLKEGSDLSQALREDLKAALLALETLSQHMVEQHMVLHDIRQQLTGQHRVQKHFSWEVDPDVQHKFAKAPPEAVEAVAPRALLSGNSVVDEVECPEATPLKWQGVDRKPLHVARTQSHNVKLSARHLPQSQACEQAEVTPSTAFEVSSLYSGVAETLAQQSLALDDIRHRLSQDRRSEASKIEKLMSTQSSVLDAFVQQLSAMQNLHERSSFSPGGLSAVKELIDTHSTIHESVVQQSSALDFLRSELPSSMSTMTTMQSQLLRDVSRLGRCQEELIQDVQHDRPEMLASLKTEVNRVLFDQLRNVRSDVSRDVRSEIGEGIARISSMVLEAVRHLTALHEEFMQAVRLEPAVGASKFKS